MIVYWQRIIKRYWFEKLARAKAMSANIWKDLAFEVVQPGEPKRED